MHLYARANPRAGGRRTHGRDKRRPSSLEGFHGSLEKDHSTKLRIISERVVVEGVILTCRTPLLRRWEITRREGSERERKREKDEPHENERANGARRRYRSTNEQERDVTGPKGGWGGEGGRGVKDRSGVGEDQTSRRATGWSLPALSLAFLPSSPPLPTKSLRASLFFSFLVGPLTRPVSLSRALILFIFPRSCSSTMWFDDLRSLRSSSVCLLPYGRARSPPQQYLAKLFDGKLHRRSRPTGLLFRNKL